MPRSVLLALQRHQAIIKEMSNHKIWLSGPKAASLLVLRPAVLHLSFCQQCHFSRWTLKSPVKSYHLASHRKNWNISPVTLQTPSPNCGKPSVQLLHAKSAKAETQPEVSVCRETDTGSNITEEAQQPSGWTVPFIRPEPQLQWDFLCNPSNRDAIRNNIINRKGIGDIDKLIELWKRYQTSQAEEKKVLWEQVLTQALDIPNISHPNSPVGDESKAVLVDIHSCKKDLDFEPKNAVDVGERLQMLRTDNVAMTTGPRTYYFLGELARLEQALVQFTLGWLQQKGFQLVSVPDLLHPDVIESCGFKTQGERTQVYRLDDYHGGPCLAGTAEMSLAGFVMNEVLEAEDLPKRLTAVSRCYRAETADVSEEKGIYRVHQFTKVEMFGVTASGDDESSSLLQEFLSIEREIFTALGLHFRILNMPTEELGAPAYCKYDIETWMPGKGFWGEISSASNCTDFQSRRLNIRYKTSDGTLKFAHTVNGTACAVPRMVMALLENNQQKDGKVLLPEVLQPYMGMSSLVPPPHKDPFIRMQTGRKR